MRSTSRLDSCTTCLVASHPSNAADEKKQKEAMKKLDEKQKTRNAGEGDKVALQRNRLASAQVSGLQAARDSHPEFPIFASCLASMGSLGNGIIPTHAIAVCRCMSGTLIYII